MRTATSVVGIAASVVDAVLGTFFIDSIDVLMDLQFYVIQRQDVTVTFVLPASGARAARDAAAAGRALRRADARRPGATARRRSDRGSSRSAGSSADPS